MSRGAQTFKRTDVTKAAEGAVDAGLFVCRNEIIMSKDLPSSVAPRGCGAPYSKDTLGDDFRTVRAAEFGGRSHLCDRRDIIEKSDQSDAQNCPYEYDACERVLL